MGQMIFLLAALQMKSKRRECDDGLIMRTAD